MLLPFLYNISTSRNVLQKNNTVHGITEDGRLVSRILPNECCWLAQIGHAITRIPDELMTCAALLDYSDHTGDRERIRQKATVGHPLELRALLDNRNMDSERIISNRAGRKYVTADETENRDALRESGNEAVNLKIDRDPNLLIGSSTYESNERKD